MPRRAIRRRRQRLPPDARSRQYLVDANGKQELARSGAQILGPGAAGLLIELASAPLALAADAISFVGSAVLLSRIRHREPTSDRSPRGRSTLVREVIEGTAYVFREPLLRAVALTALLANLFRSILVAVLHPVRRVLGTVVSLRAAIWIGACRLLLASLPYALSSVHRVISMPEPESGPR